MTVREVTVESPLGRLRLTASDDALVEVAVAVAVEPDGAGPRAGPGCPVLEEARAQLAAWFAGERRRFDLRLRPPGTPFQQAVWRAVSAIPFGETRSYAEVAAALGRPSAARAVGAALARNPLAVVVPCHRVVGAGGALTGYAWGLERKKWLLAREAEARSSPVLQGAVR